MNMLKTPLKLLKVKKKTQNRKITCLENPPEMWYNKKNAERGGGHERKSERTVYHA